jgi:hypothetical protein
VLGLAIIRFRRDLAPGTRKERARPPAGQPAPAGAVGGTT